VAVLLALLVVLILLVLLGALSGSSGLAPAGAGLTASPGGAANGGREDCTTQCYANLDCAHGGDFCMGLCNTWCGLFG